MKILFAAQLAGPMFAVQLIFFFQIYVKFHMLCLYHLFRKNDDAILINHRRLNFTGAGLIVYDVLLVRRPLKAHGDVSRDPFLNHVVDLAAIFLCRLVGFRCALLRLDFLLQLNQWLNVVVRRAHCALLLRRPATVCRAPWRFHAKATLRPSQGGAAPGLRALLFALPSLPHRPAAFRPLERRALRLHPGRVRIPVQIGQVGKAGICLRLFYGSANALLLKAAFTRLGRRTFVLFTGFTFTHPCR